MKKITQSISLATLLLSTFTIQAQSPAPDEDTGPITECRTGFDNATRTSSEQPGGAVNVGKIDDRSCYSNYSESVVNNVTWGVYNITAGSNHLGTSLQPRIERSLDRSKKTGIGSYARFTGTVRILEVGNALGTDDDGTYMMQSKGKHTGGGGSPDPAICLYLVKPVIKKDSQGRNFQASFELYREQIKYRGGSGAKGRDIVFLTDIQKNTPIDIKLEVGFRQDPNNPNRRIHYSDAVIGGKVFNWNIPEPERGVESGIRYGAYRIKGGRAQIRWTNTKYSKKEFDINANTNTATTNSKPEVTLTSPENNSTFIIGESIKLAANASDPDQNLQKVNFLINGTFYKTVTTRPFENSFSPTKAGSYTITSKAIDKNGLYSEKSVVINVTEPIETNSKPTVDITSPEEGATFQLGETITLAANASDPDQNLEKVNFKINGDFFKSITVSPFTTNFEPNKVGTYIISAKAFDKKGLNYEVFKTITIVDSQNEEPHISTNTNSCNFKLPSSNPLQTLERKSYNNIYVFGDANIDVSNIRRLRIHWDLNTSKLHQFSINTNNGTPSYYVDLEQNTEFELNKSNPDLLIKQSGIDGLDGSYWVGTHEENFVLVSKDANYSIYFSNDEEVPSCFQNVTGKLINNTTVTIYPNPSFNNEITVKGVDNQSFLLQVFSLSGRIVYTKRINNYQNEKIDLTSLTYGSYIAKITKSDNSIKIIHLIKN